MSGNNLQQKISDGSVQVATIGLGYVGLPLSVEFASSGLQVLGVDIDPARVEAVRRGESHIRGVSPERLSELVGAGYLDATTGPLHRARR